MLAQELEERTHSVDVSRRVGIEDHHIVKVGLHLFQAVHDLVDNLDKPLARSTAALGHDTPLIEARESAKPRDRNGVLVHSDSMERRNPVEQGKHPLLAQRVQDLVHARDGQLAKAADLVEFLVVDSDSNASRRFGDDNQWARIRRGRVLGQACCEVLV